LPGGFVVLREYDKLVLEDSREVPAGQPVRLRSGQVPPYVGGSATVNVPGKTRFGRYAIEATIVKPDEAGFEQFVAGKAGRVERFDSDRINLPLTVRFRRHGDRFFPLGQMSEKKLSKFLTAQRVPHRLREKVLIVADDKKIVWVCPVRMSEQAKVTSQTRSVLQIRITLRDDCQNSVDIFKQGQ